MKTEILSFRLLKEIKRICKKSEAFVEMSVELIFIQLRKKQAQVSIVSGEHSHSIYVGFRSISDNPCVIDSIFRSSTRRGVVFTIPQVSTAYC